MEGKARPILVRKGVSSPQHLGSSLLAYHPKFPQNLQLFIPSFMEFTNKFIVIQEPSFLFLHSMSKIYISEWFCP